MPPDAGSARRGARRICARSKSLYDSAPINRLFESRLDAGRRPGAVADRASRSIRSAFHAAGAAHGTLYFKMLDDAAFYAANGLVTDRFLLTTAFNLHFTKPMRDGPMRRRGALDQRQAAGVRRRSADRRCRGRGMRPRDRHLPALAHRPVRPRRLPRALTGPRSPPSSKPPRIMRQVESDGGFGNGRSSSAAIPTAARWCCS